MFPTQEVNINNLTNSSNIVKTNGKSFLFDYETGDFVVKDGKLQEIERIDALENWIQKKLRTEKNKYKIYVNGYGVALSEYITSNFPIAFIKSEIEREVGEALSTNSNIKSISDFEFTRDKRTLTVKFTVNSVYGSTVSEVII
jgi:hypothetical protein